MLKLLVFTVVICVFVIVFLVINIFSFLYNFKTKPFSELSEFIDATYQNFWRK